MTNSPGHVSYITHDAPVWRAEHNYIAMVDLAPFGFEDEWEQVWLRPLEGDEFEFCCIPFRVYGVALGDRVKLRDGKFVSSVASKSGRRVFRVFFTAPRPPIRGSDLRGALRSAISSGGFLSEWSGDRHVAVDIPAAVDPAGLFAAVEREIRDGTAYWEWGDAEPFKAEVGGHAE
ncbi:DUF4265 domain-containing protein [Microbispora sp. GKU 823]|uniref:DUF4265 domain-containing protein n=1 Tax=Microbispora sp. GKU 823 TaxID=1652100 RepID=UPI0015C484D9|nr:DUF4265 domain-containing protein [Microbispora sp. GKU 823]